MLDPALQKHELYWRHHWSIVNFLTERAWARAFWSDIPQGHKRISHFYIARWGGLAEGLPGLDKLENQELHRGYPFRHLTAHLRLAGDEALFPLVDSRAFYDAQIALDPSGAAYRTDLAHAWAAAETLDSKQTQDSRLAIRLGREVRCALATASLGSLSEGIPPALLKALVTHGQWPLTRALAAARQNPDPYKKAQGLCALVPLLPEDLQRDVLREGLAAAEKIRSSRYQAEVRMALAAHLLDGERERIEQETLDSILALWSESERMDTLAWIAPLLPEHLLAKTLDAVGRINREYEQETVLVSLAPRLPERLLRQVLCKHPIENLKCRPAMRAAQVPYLPEGERLPMMRQALDEARISGDRDWKEMAVRALAPHLPEPLWREALAIAQTISHPSIRDGALAALVARLAALGDEASALDVVHFMEIGWHQAEALATVARCLSPSQLPRALAIARAIEDPYWKAEALGTLVPCSPKVERLTLLQEALAGRKIDDADNRATTLAAFAIYLSETMRREAFAAVRQIRDRLLQSEALVILAPHLPDDLLDEAFKLARPVGPVGKDTYETRVMVALAPRLPKNLLLQALNDIPFRSERYQAEVLVALAPRLPESLLPQVFKVAHTNLRSGGGPTTHQVALVARWPEWPLQNVLDDTTRIGLKGPAGTQIEARLLAAIVPRLFGAEQASVKEDRFGEALDWIQQIHHDEWKVNALEPLVPLLPELLLPRVLDIAQTINDWPGNIPILVAVYQRLPEDSLPELVDPLLKLETENPESLVRNGLVPLLRSLPEAKRPAVLKRALKMTHAIGDINGRSRALGALGPYLVTDEATLPLGELYALWRDTLHKVTEQRRQDLLAHLQCLAPVISAFGGAEAVEETFRAIQNVGQWWP